MYDLCVAGLHTAQSNASHWTTKREQRGRKPREAGETHSFGHL